MGGPRKGGFATQGGSRLPALNLPIPPSPSFLLLFLLLLLLSPYLPPSLPLSPSSSFSSPPPQDYVERAFVHMDTEVDHRAEDEHSYPWG